MLFDNFRNQVEPRLDRGSDRLELLALVGFGHFVRAQAQLGLGRMRHGFNAGGIDGIHLLYEPEYPRERFGIRTCFLGGDPQPSEVGDFPDLGCIKRHAVVSGAVNGVAPASARPYHIPPFS